MFRFLCVIERGCVQRARRLGSLNSFGFLEIMLRFDGLFGRSYRRNHEILAEGL